MAVIVYFVLMYLVYKIMKSLFTILGVVVLVIGLLCFGVWVVQILINYILDYFAVPIRRLDFMVTLAIVLACSCLFSPFRYKKDN